MSKDLMSLYRIKNELLCFGMSVDADVIKYIENINPYTCKEKYVHAAGFCLEGKICVNTTFTEMYTSSSPYTVRKKGNGLYLFRDNEGLCDIQVIKMPEWYNNYTSLGTRMYDILNVHGKNVLALTHYSDCYYNSIGKPCKFCSFTENYEMRKKSKEDRIQEIVETLDVALVENPNYSLALSEGAKPSADRGILYFAEIINSVKRKFHEIKISVETVPPPEDKYLDYLFSQGASSIIMNIEFWDNQIKKKMCPGKSEIGIARYFEALEHSVDIFGIGNVASVLIAGIEPIDNTILCSEKLLEIGVIPIIIPFKPYDNCELSKGKITSPEVLEIIASRISKKIRELHFPLINPFGCIGCGSCNITNFYEKIVGY